MVGIKDIDMPKECWDCELTHDDPSGYTVCSVTGRILYPMGDRDSRFDDCPLVDIK